MLYTVIRLYILRAIMYPIISDTPDMTAFKFKLKPRSGNAY